VFLSGSTGPRARIRVTTELGSLTLKRIGFFCFPIQHTPNCTYLTSTGSNIAGREQTISVPGKFPAVLQCCYWLFLLRSPGNRIFSGGVFGGRVMLRLTSLYFLLRTPVHGESGHPQGFFPYDLSCCSGFQVYYNATRAQGTAKARIWPYPNSLQSPIIPLSPRTCHDLT
jgi:hypothetical protein